MSAGDLHFHYVCTINQARQIISTHNRFWVSNCGCREQRGSICARSRLDLCLQFRAEAPAFGSNMHEIGFVEVEAIFTEAISQKLVARPFRREDDRTVTDGICFCCDDCCDYFINPSASPCDKGSLIENTDAELCTNCGTCVEVCYFGARSLWDDKLSIDLEKCYGCGSCVEVCPEGCIEMV